MSTARRLPRPLARAYRSRLVKGSVATLLIAGGGTGLRYGLQVAFARLAGVGQYGKYVYAMSLAQFLLIFTQLGLGQVVVKFVPAYLHDGDWPSLRGLLRRSLQITVALSAGIALVAALLVIALDPLPGQKTTLVAGLVLLPIIAWCIILREATRATENVVAAYSRSELPPPIIAAIVGAVVWRIVPHVTGAWLMMATLVAYILTMAVQRAGVRRVLGDAYRSATVRYHTRQWLSVALPLMTFAGLQAVMNNVDLFTVGLVKGSEAAGYYGAANKTAFLVSFLLLATAGIAGPMIARASAAGDEAELRRLTRRSVQLVAMPTFVIVAFILAFAPQIMATFGKGFSGGIFPLRVLALGQLVNALTGPISFLFTLTDGQVRIAKITGVMAALQVAALAIVVPSFGPRGAAIVSTSTVTVWQGWMYLAARRRFGIRLIGRYPSDRPQRSGG